MLHCADTGHEKASFGTDVFAPFSAMAHTNEGLEFYRLMRTDPDRLHDELAIQTEKTITEINGLLPSIISIADPYVNPSLVSEEDAQVFSLPYLIRVLKSFNRVSGGVVQICPYCTERLEWRKFVRIERIHLQSETEYRNVLTEYSRTKPCVILGGQCVHTKLTDHISVLCLHGDET